MTVAETRQISAAELETPLLPYEEAIGRTVEAAAPLSPCTEALDDALGLVAAADVTSSLDVPPFAGSAMDGYAVRSEDIGSASEEAPLILPVMGQAPAGSGPATLAAGTASTVATGGPIPAGADTVVPWELTERRGADVAILRAIPRGTYVRPAGEDVPRGSTVIRRGETLASVHLGVLASIGFPEVSVHPHPRVAILSTGSELARPGTTLPAGAVFDANRTLLSGMARSLGAEVVATGTVSDDPDAVATWLRRHATADLVVTSGGMSVGERDWVRPVLEAEGDVVFWRVAVKPGKPVAVARFGPALVLAVPGNPGSAFACMHAFGGRILRRMLGRPAEPRFGMVPLGADAPASPARTTLTRAQLRDGAAWPLPAQSSVVLSNLVPADGFALVPPGGLPAGATVRFEPFQAL